MAPFDRPTGTYHLAFVTCTCNWTACNCWRESTWPITISNVGFGWIRRFARGVTPAEQRKEWRWFHQFRPAARVAVASPILPRAARCRRLNIGPSQTERARMKRRQWIQSLRG